MRKFQTANTTRTPRRTQRRAMLGLEGLEDRLVMSAAMQTSSALLHTLPVVTIPIVVPHTTATQNGSTLTINALPGSFGPISPILPLEVAHIRTITLQEDPTNHAMLDVLDSGNLVGKFKIRSISTVDIDVAGLDNVTILDTKGLPFASGTTVSVFGSGSLNSLTLKGGPDGGRIISGGETYTAGHGLRIVPLTLGRIDDGILPLFQPGSLTLGGDTFTFTSAIGSVTDSIKTTGQLVVKAFGSDVTLSGTDGVTQTLSGLSIGGAGDNLTFSNKNLVNLEMFSANANATLNATAAAAGEHFFVVDLFGNDEGVTINATPRGVTTSVVAGGEGCGVFVAANSSPVFINGTSTTNAILGTNHGNDGVTSGIRANVTVENVGTLVIGDAANHTTPENVKVTESTISGTGLFGNSAAVVHYSGTGHVQIHTGAAADTYTIAGSKPGAHFGSSIGIDDEFASGGLNVGVTVDAGSGLDLRLFAFFTTIFVKGEHLLGQDVSLGQPPVTLSLLGLHGKYSQPTPTLPDGDETVTFAGGRTSGVNYEGFTSVTLDNPNGTVGPLP
jgi:hypothetical protein